MEALDVSAKKHTFLLIAIAISIYFGVHGFYFLKDKWVWPLSLSISTIVLIELIWLNVFRPKTYAKEVNLLAGVIAMSFCVFLPFLSSWSDYQKLERKATVAIKIEQPEYYNDNVIPALEYELSALESRIAPRIAERKRRASIGKSEYSREILKDGTLRLYSGIEAASWIPVKGKEKEAFRRVEQLRNQIRKYREADLKAKNSFKEKQTTQVAKIAGLNADVDNGRLSFGFKGILILALGLFSLYYMYSYSNPGKGDDPDEPKSHENLPPIAKKSAKKQPKKIPIRSEDKKFVLEKYPNAIGILLAGGKGVEIRADGKVIGSSTLAPHAWRDAKKNILSGGSPRKLQIAEQG